MTRGPTSTSSASQSPDGLSCRGSLRFPSASIEALKRRAAILAAIRGFFDCRGVLEVETPVLCQAGAVDEHLDPILASYHPPGRPSGEGIRLYLATSPEHSMKRLLAAGSGPIYQITRAFRDGERGRLHNPEFTMLEWYRPGFDQGALMSEVEDLVRGVLAAGQEAGPEDLREAVSRPFERIAYREAFLRALGVEPFAAPVSELARMAGSGGTAEGGRFQKQAVERGAGETGGAETGTGMAGAASGAHREEDRDSWLNLLLATAVEPTLGLARPTFLCDYPASQAALARVRAGDPPVAERFELYIRGVEIANGYHELADPLEQERRFVEANQKRTAAGKEALPLDTRFLDALRAGLPSCSGVALGVDRLVLLASGASSLDEVIAFPIERA